MLMVTNTIVILNWYPRINRGGKDIPVTVKCRIGVNNQDSYEWLLDFVETVATQGDVKHFFVVRNLFYRFLFFHSFTGTVHSTHLLFVPLSLHPACSQGNFGRSKSGTKSKYPSSKVQVRTSSYIFSQFCSNTNPFFLLCFF